MLPGTQLFSDLTGLHVGLNYLRQLLRGHYARLPPNRLSFVKQNQGRNTLDPELLGGRLITVYIHFYHLQLALVLGRYLLQNGRHSFARPAPIRIKIDQYRHAGAINEFGK
jgi:hypothetical protein